MLRRAAWKLSRNCRAYADRDSRSACPSATIVSNASEDCPTHWGRCDYEPISDGSRSLGS